MANYKASRRPLAYVYEEHAFSDRFKEDLSEFKVGTFASVPVPSGKGSFSSAVLMFITLELSRLGKWTSQGACGVVIK